MKNDTWITPNEECRMNNSKWRVIDNSIWIIRNEWIQNGQMKQTTGKWNMEKQGEWTMGKEHG